MERPTPPSDGKPVPARPAAPRTAAANPAPAARPIPSTSRPAAANATAGAPKPPAPPAATAAARPAADPAPAAGSASAPADSVADFAQPVGTMPCKEPDCLRHDGVRCNYADSRGRRCSTAWCPEHRASVGGVAYCRRHANTIIALGERGNDPAALPDLDNRGPSLVNWVYRDLDHAVRRGLEAVGQRDERVVRDASVTVVFTPQRRRSWERSWRLMAPGERRMRVSVAVDELDDARVLIRVQDELVAKGTPPWIDRHRRGVDVTPTIDSTQRQLFYGFLVDHVAHAVRTHRSEAPAAKH